MSNPLRCQRLFDNVLRTEFYELSVRMLDNKYGRSGCISRFKHIDHLIDNAITACVDINVVVAEIAYEPWFATEGMDGLC